MSPGSFLYWPYTRFFVQMISTTWNALMRSLQSYASNCLLIMLLLPLQAARTSYRFSFKAEHWSDLSWDLYIYVIHFSRTYLYLPILYRILSTLLRKPNIWNVSDWLLKILVLYQEMKQAPHDSQSEAALY